MIRLTTNSNTSEAVLDAYFAATSMSPESRYNLAIEIWRTLRPDEKRVLQNTARKLAGDNLELGAELNQSLLLLEHLNARNVMQASTDPAIPLFQS